MNSCSFLEMTHSTEIALYRRKKMKVISYSFSWPIEMNYFFIQFFSSSMEVTVCVQAHLFSTDLLREGCFSVQRPESFNTNVGPQYQLNDCYRGFLSSINCWSPVSSPDINLPASLLKKISLPLQEVHSGLEWPTEGDWVSCGVLSLAFGFMSRIIILYNVFSVLLIHRSQG